MNNNLESRGANSQTLAVQSFHQADPVVSVPRDLLALLFTDLNAHEFKSLCLVSKLWRSVAINSDFAKIAHWYPELSKICKLLSTNIKPETQSHTNLLSIISTPEPIELEAYKDALVLTLNLLPIEELKRLASLDLPLPPAYKNIFQSAMKVFHTWSGAERSWAPRKNVVSIECSTSILNLTGVNLLSQEAFVTFRVTGLSKTRLNPLPIIPRRNLRKKSLPRSFSLNCWINLKRALQ